MTPVEIFVVALAVVGLLSAWCIGYMAKSIEQFEDDINE